MTRTSGGAPERICDCAGLAEDWSRDNSKLLYLERKDADMEIFVLDVGTGSRRLVARHPPNDLFHGRFSPDGRWISFMEVLRNRRSRIWIAPFVNGMESDPTTWIPLTTGEWWDDVPRWSPFGSLIYFMSDRDGFRCIWAQRLDRATRRPAGEPFAVVHFHTARSLMNIWLPFLSLEVGRDSLIFNMGEVTANDGSSRPRPKVGRSPP
jgi:hypothetical protein